MPAAPPAASRQADAILCPLGRPVPQAGEGLLEAIRREFGPVLGAKVVHSRKFAYSQRFLTADPTESVLFPVGHPRAGEDRYDWRPRPENDGVLYGTLKADPPEAPAAPAVPIAPALTQEAAPAHA